MSLLRVHDTQPVNNMSADKMTTGRSSERLRVELPILMYHDIGSRSSNPRFREFVVERSLFEEHLAALRDEGFITEPVSRLPAIERTSTPEFPVFITFDDAYVSFAESAWPALDNFKMTATLFVPTAYVGERAAWLDVIGEGDRRILDWQTLRELRASGVEIGSHGHEHLQMDRLPRNQLITEIQTSRALLEESVGEPIRTFAYPFGYHSRTVRRELRRCGFDLAFQVAHDLYTPSPNRHYSIRRIHVGPDMSPDELLSTIRLGRSSRPVQTARLYLVPAMHFFQRQKRRWQSLPITK